LRSRKLRRPPSQVAGLGDRDQNRANCARVFDRRDQPKPPAAARAGQHVDVVANPGVASGMTFIYLALFGVIQFGLGLLLLRIGRRLVTAMGSSLIKGLQIPLAPAWVWLAFGEVPTLATCIGGLIVVVAIVCEAVVKSPAAWAAAYGPTTATRLPRH